MCLCLPLMVLAAYILIQALKSLEMEDKANVRL
jgi:hypothetical protein